ncbi:MAG: proteasome subunit beta [Candidatus Aenigmarchaeota archaeon]|nr:proteasome subunit beta [Candidatus Aenigmarchaeota archaeon]
MKTGTTTVALSCTDGVVLAADQKATMGNLVASKKAKKVFEITDKIGLTIAGSVGDAQAVTKLLKAEVQIYEMQEGTITTKAAASLLGMLLRSSYKSFVPELVQLILGGVDERGSEVYSVTLDGAVMKEDDYTFTGSGSPIALGVLEDAYKNDLSVEGGIKLVARAVKAARERDVYSGGLSVDIATITKDGIKWIPETEIKKLLS